MMNMKNEIIDELNALVPLGIAGAEETLAQVEEGIHDMSIDGFEAISVTDATDLLISMRDGVKPGDGR